MKRYKACSARVLVNKRCAVEYFWICNQKWFWWSPQLLGKFKTGFYPGAWHIWNTNQLKSFIFFFPWQYWHKITYLSTNFDFIKVTLPSVKAMESIFKLIGHVEVCAPWVPGCPKQPCLAYMSTLWFWGTLGAHCSPLHCVSTQWEAGMEASAAATWYRKP